MTNEEVMAHSKWPAHLTIDQMRGQIAWEQSPEYAALKRELDCNQEFHL